MSVEIRMIEESRQKIRQHELELEEKNKQLESALVEAKEQTLQARAKALAANAREIVQRDPTSAIRLAEASMQITPEPTRESRSAFVDILKRNTAFYKRVLKHSDSVNSVAFSPDGKSILTGSDDNSARLWDLKGNTIQVFEGHSNTVSSVAFSPDGKSILTGSWDNSARLWPIYWERLNPQNTAIPTAEEMKEYDIPESIEWGKRW